MKPLKSASLMTDPNNVPCGIFFFCFGMCFLLLGLGALNGSGFQLLRLPSIDFGLLLFLGFGAMMTWGGVSYIRMGLRLGPRQATVAQTMIRPGDSFDFAFEQKLRGLLEVHSIEVYFVFRERVTFESGGESSTEDTDRLIQQFKRPGRKFGPGEVIREEHRFTVPNHPLGVRNRFMGRDKAALKTLWVVKVRLDTDGYAGLTYDFEIEVSGEPEGPLPEVAADATRRRYDLFMIGKGPGYGLLKSTKVLLKTLPFLRPSQTGDAAGEYPCLLTEGMTMSEAQEIKSALEAVGVQVDIRLAQYLR